MPTEAFAQTPQVATQLMETFDDATTAAVEAMLVDASNYLRGVIGQRVYPPAQATVTRRLRCPGNLLLPQVPVISIDSVTVDGVTVDVDPDEAPWVYVPRGGKAKLTFTYGYALPPEELSMWAVVLAAQALASVRELKTIGSGNVSSVSIDDYRKAYASGGANGVGYVLPQRIMDDLRESWGSSSHVVRATR